MVSKLGCSRGCGACLAEGKLVWHGGGPGGGSFLVAFS